MDLETCIPKRTKKYLGEIGAIKELLATNEADPLFLTQRIQELNLAHIQMVSRMNPDDPEKYPQVLQLKTKLVKFEAFLTTSSPGNIGVNPNIGKNADKTFTYIAERIDDEWSFITAIPDPKQGMSVMLLKGYSQLLQIFNPNVPSLANQYEKAMLEVLENDFPDSTLAQDLLPHYPITQSA